MIELVTMRISRGMYELSLFLSVSRTDNTTHCTVYVTPANKASCYKLIRFQVIKRQKGWTKGVTMSLFCEKLYFYGLTSAIAGME